MTTIAWQKHFTELFHRGVKKYQSGAHTADEVVDAEGCDFLLTIGAMAQEFFDFVEDFAKGGEPTLETALALAAVRKEYFEQEQHGTFSPHPIKMSDLPSKDAEVEGIGWLPRLIPKAEAKLRGEMPPDLMYGCGGDRKFFRTQGIDPVEFLRQVWKAQGQNEATVAWVKSRKKGA